MRQRPIARVLLALVLVGCTTPVASPGGRSGPVPTKPTSATRPDGPSATAPSASGLIAPGGSGAPNGSGLPAPIAVLRGVVTVPARVVSNNGGNILANNGAGLIANPGGGIVYRARYSLLAAPTEVLVSGATVALVDAAGQPVLRDGTPMQAVTDAQGRYSFEAVPRDHNMVARTVLSEQIGTLTAVVAREGAAPVDLNLVSTLTTTYMLEQYVKPQANPIATLDRLPARLEADTREKAAVALANSAELAPERLATDQVERAVKALRARDKAFDTQLETLRQALVVAGLEDLGDGRPATEVFLGPVRGIVPAPDGTVYLDADETWQVDAQGKLHRVTAKGAWHGTLGLDAGGSLLRGGDDGAGHAGLWRRGADGVVRDLAQGQPIKLYSPTNDGGYDAVLQAPAGGRSAVVHVAADGAVSPLGQVPEPGFTPLALAHDASGKPVMMGALNDLPGNPFATALATRIALARPDAIVATALPVNPLLAFAALDPGGRLYRPTAKGLEAITPEVYGAPVAAGTPPVALDAAWQPLPGTAPTVSGGDLTPQTGTAASTGLKLLTVVTAPDGTLYVGRGDTVYRVRGGEASLFAGKPKQAVGANSQATSVALKDPQDLAVSADGTMYVIDGGVILRVDAQGKASPLPVSLVDQGATLTPTLLRLAPDGRLLVGTAMAIFGVDPAHPEAATVLQRPAPSNHGWIAGMATGPDGTTYVAQQPSFPGRGGGKLFLASASGTTVLLDSYAPPFDEWGGAALQDLTLDGQGRLLAVAFKVGSAGLPASPFTGRSWTWTAGQGLADRDVKAFWPQAYDKLGRAYSDGGKASPAATLDRLDPATGQVTHLVGPGGKLLAGTGVEDGVARPRAPRLDAAGNLYFIDTGHKLVRRISADQL